MDVAVLDANFKRLQRRVHPDLCVNRSKREQDASASASSAINVAHKVLRNPAARASYILRLNGIDALGEGAGTGGVSGMLLMQVMEARELIGDPSSDVREIEELKRRNSMAVEACVRDLALAFRKGDLQTAKAITVALQYYTKIDDEVTERLEAEAAKREKADKVV